MNPSKKSYVFALLSVILWSTVATSFKLGLSELNYIQLIFYSSGFSLIILFFILIIQNKFRLLFHQSLSEWLSSMLLGVFNPFLYYLILFKAYSLLPAQLAQPLNMVWPIVFTLLSVIILHQKIGKRSILGMLVSFSGVILISSQGSLDGLKSTNLLGILLALTSSVIWSFFWILTLRDKRDKILKLFSSFLFGFLYLFFVMLIFSDFRINLGIGLYSSIYIGLFELSITYIFWLKALHLSSNNANISNLIFLSPFLSLIFIHFILKETLFLTTFVGLTLIIGGILAQQSDKKRSSYS